ncbi:MAG TPA: peptide-methionine (R)-S-oxide reductase MsrB [Burkholderiaceae bacterium]|jgi:peptide-methionine (R)-S-oxide reductase|nr:peptide-methionine (R)-S-oxide reductase MsrB [Burkholderiaceae bacterium]
MATSPRPDALHAHDDPRYAVQKTDAQWREQLDPMQYQVARHAATERAFTGKFWDVWADGTYRCAACGQVLFDSAAKFDAGCGWPSYSSAIEEGRVERVVDDTHGMHRVEVRCARCGSHLGHVFDDGPDPTGERFCINSAALDFDPSK